jgi:hypothetical protein
MSDDKTICVICAWRKDCRKKFSMDGATTTRCPDFTKDITLKREDSDMDSHDPAAEPLDRDN